MSTVGLYLMTEKGLAVLEAALESGVEIAHVTTAPARGMDDGSDRKIEQMAKAAGVPAFLHNHPPTYAGDYSLAVGWRWMLDAKNLIVMHDSLLPRYRGFSPLVTALVNGDPQVGVTAILAGGAFDGYDPQAGAQAFLAGRPEAGYDTGPIVSQRSLPVSYPTTMREVLMRLAPLYAEIALPLFLLLKADAKIAYTAQDHSAATYSIWRDEDDYRIDWNLDDRTIVRLIGAVSSPFPGAWTTLEIPPGFPESDVRIDLRVRITDAVVETDVRFEQRHPGKVAFVRDGCPVVVCGTGMIRVLESSQPIPFRTRLR